MTSPIQSYELSEEADLDLENVFDYTLEEFGIEQAIAYTLEFDKSFEALVHNPKLGRERHDIKNGLRSINKDSHIIFYRILKDKIRIVRIIHGSRDLPRFL